MHARNPSFQTGITACANVRKEAPGTFQWYGGVPRRSWMAARVTVMRIQSRALRSTRKEAFLVSNRVRRVNAGVGGTQVT